MVACLYLLVRGTVWEGHLMEWLNIIVRLMHITFGIAWIGASFYFVFLEKCRLTVPVMYQEELATGNLWAIHGGRVWITEKYKVAPKSDTTDTCIGSNMRLISPGYRFNLLFVVYYFNAGAMLIDKDHGTIVRPPSG